MLAIGTQARFSIGETEKIVVRAAIRQYCSDPDAVRRIVRAIEKPSRETGRIIMAAEDRGILVETLQAAIGRIHAETEGRGQLTCQALTAVINKINGN
jgi:hypothetical protein